VQAFNARIHNFTNVHMNINSNGLAVKTRHPTPAPKLKRYLFSCSPCYTTTSNADYQKCRGSYKEQRRTFKNRLLRLSG